MRHSDPADITPEFLLEAYAHGIFPMAESEDDPELFWVEPKKRGVLPLGSFHLPRRLRRTVASDAFEMRIDHDFEAVIAACAAPAPGRDNTWINAPIRALYGELFRMGHCHTVEAWQNGALVGGLYGVRLGGAFFGESMFHRARDASKVALVHLVARLVAGGFQLLDAQFVTNHLSRFGAIELPRRAYKAALSAAVAAEADWWALERHARAAKATEPLQRFDEAQVLPAADDLHPIITGRTALAALGSTALSGVSRSDGSI